MRQSEQYFGVVDELMKEDDQSDGPWQIGRERPKGGRSMTVLLERGVCEAGMFLWQDIFLLLLYQMAQWSFHIFAVAAGDLKFYYLFWCILRARLRPQNAPKQVIISLTQPLPVR